MAYIKDPHRSRRASPVDALIGLRLRNARLNTGLSQIDLARGLGVTFQQIQKYERGSNRISAATLRTASEILGVSLDSFFDDAVPDSSIVAKPILGSRAEVRLVAGFRKASPAVRRALLALLEASKNPGEHMSEES